MEKIENQSFPFRFYIISISVFLRAGDQMRLFDLH